MLRRIEQVYGQESVRQAFLLDGDEFMERYKHLLVE
jgi:hypothetical protein